MIAKWFVHLSLLATVSLIAAAAQATPITAVLNGYDLVKVGNPNNAAQSGAGGNQNGGGWGGNDPGVSSSGRGAIDPSSEEDGIGFRLASPVPEPATLGIASVGGLSACGWWILERRRRART